MIFHMFGIGFIYLGFLRCQGFVSVNGHIFAILQIKPIYTRAFAQSREHRGAGGIGDAVAVSFSPFHVVDRERRGRGGPKIVPLDGHVRDRPRRRRPAVGAPTGRMHRDADGAPSGGASRKRLLRITRFRAKGPSIHGPTFRTAHTTPGRHSEGVVLDETVGRAVDEACAGNCRAASSSAAQNPSAERLPCSTTSESARAQAAYPVPQGSSPGLVFVVNRQRRSARGFLGRDRLGRAQRFERILLRTRECRRRHNRLASNNGDHPVA